MRVRRGIPAWRTGQVALAVAAVGLNFRDVLNVLGLYPGDPGAPGGDCAGTVTAVGRSARHSYRRARHHQKTLCQLGISATPSLVYSRPRCSPRSIA